MALKNIKSNTKKGDKETDHLFIDDLNKNIYYAELKSNLNLDTEKRKGRELYRLIMKPLKPLQSLFS